MSTHQYTVTFWRSADETETPIYYLSLSEFSDSEALYKAAQAFASQCWDSEVDHVTIKKHKAE